MMPSAPFPDALLTPFFSVAPYRLPSNPILRNLSSEVVDVSLGPELIFISVVCFPVVVPDVR